MFSFSLASGVLNGFSGSSGSGEVVKEALGLGIPVPKRALGLEGEPPPKAVGLEGMFPEAGLGLGGALGGGGLLGGAEVLWIEALFFDCSESSLEVRVRRTTSGREDGCFEGFRDLPGAGAGMLERTSSWHLSFSMVGMGWAWFGPLQAGKGSSSSEELASDPPSSVSSSFKDSSLILESCSRVVSRVSSSSAAEIDSVSLIKECAEGLVGEVRGLETEDIRTGGEMTKERLLPLDSPFTTKTLLECCFSSLLITS